MKNLLIPEDVWNHIILPFKKDFEEIDAIVEREFGYYDVTFNYDVKYAIGMGWLAAVNYLLHKPRRCLDIDSWFMQATRLGHLDIVKLLVAFCANVVGNDISGIYYSGIYTAASYGHLEVLKYLLELVNDYSYFIADRSEVVNRAVDAASSSGEINVVQFLCELVDENGNRIFDSSNVDLETPVDRGHLAVVKYLCEVVAKDGNSIHNNNLTHLECAAAYKGRKELANFLHSHYNNGREDLWWQDELKYANGMGRFSVVSDLLLKNGPRYGYLLEDLLDQAAEVGHLDVVKLLVDLGVDCSYDYYRAFFTAAFDGHLDVVQYLLDVLYDHDLYQVCKGALSDAIDHGKLNVVQFFCELEDYEGNRIYDCSMIKMDFAVERGHLDVVRYLCELKDKSGSGNDLGNFHYMAAYNGKKDVAEYLFDYSKKLKNKSETTE